MQDLDLKSLQSTRRDVDQLLERIAKSCVLALVNGVWLSAYRVTMCQGIIPNDMGKRQ